MKKLFKISLLTLSLFSLTSCNENLGFGNYHFNKIHLVHQNKCLEISSWHDNETGVEVHLLDGSTLWCSEGTYIMVSGTCPICTGALQDAR